MARSPRQTDGVPVRAEDVRYTFHAYTSDAVLSEARSLLGNIDSVSVRDSLTAVFWFKRRTPQQFLDATYIMFVLPSHLLATLPDTALVNAPFGRQPVGTGRFRFVKWDAGTRLEIAADTANARGRAKLDRVIWTFVSDLGAATVKLFAGEADFLEQIKPENIPQVLSAPSLRLESNLPLQYGYVGFNLRMPRSPAGPTGPAHPVFGDARVRRALTMALDRPRMVRSVLDSLGMVSFSAAPRVLIPDTAALRQIPFDPAGAMALLDSAGWKDTNGDGIRELNGKPLQFDLLVPSSSTTRTKLAVLVQAAFKNVGAAVTVQALDPSALGPRLEARDFDAWMGGWQTNPGLQGMRQTWASRGTLLARHQSRAVAFFVELLTWKRNHASCRTKPRRLANAGWARARLEAGWWTSGWAWIGERSPRPEARRRGWSVGAGLGAGCRTSASRPRKAR